MFGRKKDRMDLVPSNYLSLSPASVFEDMERLFADLRAGFYDPMTPSTSMERVRVPVMDLREEEDAYLICAELPGMLKNDVSVEIVDDALEITARKESLVEEEKEGYLRKERGSMSFFRRMILPENVDRDGIKAKLDNGVLEVSIPKSVTGPEMKTRIELD